VPPAGFEPVTPAFAADRFGLVLLVIIGPWRARVLMVRRLSMIAGDSH
jgi:hypothetical protein